MGELRDTLKPKKTKQRINQLEHHHSQTKINTRFWKRLAAKLLAVLDVILAIASVIKRK